MARRQGGRTIDFKEWAGIPSLINEIGANATILGGSLAFTAPATILRARGRLYAQFDETVQVGDRIIVTFGLGIVSTDSYTVGSTAMPDPGGEPEYPWLWWGQVMLEAGVAAGHSGGFGPTAQQLEVDTKAMRKIKPGQSLAWVWELAGAAGSPVTIVSQGETRVLIGT